MGALQNNGVEGGEVMDGCASVADISTRAANIFTGGVAA